MSSLECCSIPFNCRLRTSSLSFFLGPLGKTPETHKWPRAWLKARDGRGTTKESLSFFFSGCRPRFSHLAASPLNARARVHRPLTKSEEKERLLAVYFYCCKCTFFEIWITEHLTKKFSPLFHSHKILPSALTSQTRSPRENELILSCEHPWKTNIWQRQGKNIPKMGLYLILLSKIASLAKIQVQPWSKHIR